MRILTEEQIRKYKKYVQSRLYTLQKELRSCVKVEVDVLGSLSLINLRFLWT